MRFSLKMLALFATILVIGLAADSIHAKQSGTWGTGDFSGYYGTVYVGSLTYESDFGWTQSSHWYEVINMFNFVRLSVPYEFQHGVWEVRNGNDKGRFVNNSQQQATDRTDRNGYVYRDSTQGVNCNGQRAGQYFIEAYTAIRVSERAGSLEVKVTDTSKFRIWD